MLKSFIGADMRLYERFGIGLHNISYFKIAEQLLNTGLESIFVVKNISTLTTPFEKTSGVVFLYRRYK